MIKMATFAARKGIKRKNLDHKLWKIWEEPVDINAQQNDRQSWKMSFYEKLELTKKTFGQEIGKDQ